MNRHTPDYLKVIEGGRAGKESNARRFWKAAILSAGIATVGVSAGLLNWKAHGNVDGELLAGHGGAVIVHNKQAEQLQSLSQRMESLSNQELIGKMLREGEEPVFQRGLEHNMATLILETRKERAVPDMADALQSNPSPMVRSALAYALGRMGFQSALPALKAAAADTAHPGVKKAAEEAISSIEAKNGK